MGETELGGLRCGLGSRPVSGLGFIGSRAVSGLGGLGGFQIWGRRTRSPKP